MTAWDYAKSKGLTLKIISEETGQSLETLRNWYNNEKKRKVFDLIVDGIKSRDCTTCGDTFTGCGDNNETPCKNWNRKA